MTAPAGEVRYAESGASWWTVPGALIFAAAGAGVDALTGRIHAVAWLVAGVALAGFAVIWVRARRRLYSVSLTDAELRQGEETLAVQRISRLLEEDEGFGKRVLGGALTVPRKFDEVPLQLDDGTVVLGWARDGQALRTALRPLLPGADEQEES